MPDTDPTARSQFLVLSGEGVTALDAAHIEALRISASAMVGGRTVEATVTLDVSSVEPAPRREPSSMNLVGMSPEEVLRTHDDIHAERDLGGAAHEELQEAFTNGVVALPSQDPEAAPTIYAILAHPSSADNAREVAAVCIPRLLAADVETALALWGNLLKDENQKVAEHARESVDYAFSYEEITPEQALRLIRAHRSAWPRD